MTQTAPFAVFSPFSAAIKAVFVRVKAEIPKCVSGVEKVFGGGTGKVEVRLGCRQACKIEGEDEKMKDRVVLWEFHFEREARNSCRRRRRPLLAQFMPIFIPIPKHICPF